MKLGIFIGFDDYYKNYVNACKDLNVDYELIDIKSANWIELIKNSKCDGFLHNPSCLKQVYKDMFDQKLFFVKYVLGYKIYPDFLESFIYESKKGMAYWLDIYNFPHAKTYVFYDKKEALEFINSNEKWPLYFKTNIGSAAIGVKKISSKFKAKKIINKIFSKNFFYGRGYTKWYHSKKYKILSVPLVDDKQHNFVIFQENINAVSEWRIIKIGNSYFGHKKLAKNNFFSGSGLVGWEKPSIELLELAKNVCQKGNFDCMDLDIFEDSDGKYFINELQTIFGSYNKSQMYINNKPGRFKYIDEQWLFEEGYFNQNASCNLRVLSFVEALKNAKKTRLVKNLGIFQPTTKN